MIAHETENTHPRKSTGDVFTRAATKNRRLEETHGDRAVDDDAARRVRRAAGPRDPSLRHQAQDLELVEQTRADPTCHGLVRPHADVEVPHGRVVRRDGGDASENVERRQPIAQGAEEALAVGVVHGTLREGVRQVRVGEAVDGGEEALHGGEGAVASPDLDAGEAWGERDVLHGGGEVDGGVHGEVEDGVGKGEARDELDHDGPSRMLRGEPWRWGWFTVPSGAGSDDLGVQVPVSSWSGWAFVWCGWAFDAGGIGKKRKRGEKHDIMRSQRRIIPTHHARAVRAVLSLDVALTNSYGPRTTGFHIIIVAQQTLDVRSFELETSMRACAVNKKTAENRTVSPSTYQQSRLSKYSKQ